MIGNDVVDLILAATQSNWQRKGFLEKLFSKNEQKIILNSEVPEILVWRLWTMKESVYKAHQRRFSLAPQFNPRELQCKIFSSEKGEVEIDSCIYSVSSEVSAEFIYSEAVPKNSIFERISQFRIGISSEALKVQALEKFGSLCRQENNNLAIQKSENGVPFFSSGNRLFDTPVSFTHHGNYSAFTIALPSNKRMEEDVKK